MKINKNKKEEGKEKKKGNKGQVSQKEPWIERLKKKKKGRDKAKEDLFSVTSNKISQACTNYTRDP